MNGHTPHSSPHKETKQERTESCYPSPFTMSPQRQHQQLRERAWSPPANVRVRTPETYRQGSLCTKRKCVSESNLSNKCYIREIARGMDRMIIKMKSPSPGVGDPFFSAPYVHGSSENTMDCFPHSFQCGQSSPPLVSPLPGPSDSSRSWPEAKSGKHSIDVNRNQCTRSLWGLPERIEGNDDEEEENGFVMGMDYCADDEGPSSTHMNIDALPKRIIQLRKELLGSDIQPGIFVRDANAYGYKQQFSGLARHHTN